MEEPVTFLFHFWTYCKNLITLSNKSFYGFADEKSIYVVEQITPLFISKRVISKKTYNHFRLTFFDDIFIYSIKIAIITQWKEKYVWSYIVKEKIQFFGIPSS